MEGDIGLADRIPARLTAAEGRKFAFTVGIAFLVLAGISYWRGHTRVPVVLASLGGVLLLAGLIVPASLGPVQRGWMGFAHVLSKITTPIFMGIVYFLVITPIGLFRQMIGKNAMVQKAKPDTGYWSVRDRSVRSDMRRLF